MDRRDVLKLVALTVAVASTGIGVSSGGELPSTLKDQLVASKYVYIASERKGGGFSKPAEIWFFYYQDAVWVGTPSTTWRAKRIKAGRRTAKIAVGSLGGPSFEATGEFVKDPTVYEKMFETYAKKYPDGWPKFEQKFRDGFKDGSRVLIKYTPK
ncbi:MAG: twin-arginine translocation signal domain-containing protein [Deltaproteobacteria bacterium]|nr:twin-arginine translocation signal domain-containing protein [Deltaproteobacteria bacterium]MBI3386767.1 twin-arginine translocation signal domain-containing protein [Deltaproteobacteria bacterium]